MSQIANEPVSHHHRLALALASAFLGCGATGVALAVLNRCERGKQGPQFSSAKFLQQLDQIFGARLGRRPALSEKSKQALGSIDGALDYWSYGQ